MNYIYYICDSKLLYLISFVMKSVSKKVQKEWEKVAATFAIMLLMLFTGFGYNFVPMSGKWYVLCIIVFFLLVSWCLYYYIVLLMRSETKAMKLLTSILILLILVMAVIGAIIFF